MFVWELLLIFSISYHLHNITSKPLHILSIPSVMGVSLQRDIYPALYLGFK